MDTPACAKSSTERGPGRQGQWAGAWGSRRGKALSIYSKRNAKTLEFDKIHILRTSLWLVCGEQTGRGTGKKAKRLVPSSGPGT